MPRISAFYGIFIYMYYRDHAPPHFHAIYGDAEAEIVIATGAIRAGYLPSRALRLVREWTETYRVELEQNWNLARSGMPLQRIAPLD